MKTIKKQRKLKMVDLIAFLLMSSMSFAQNDSTNEATYQRDGFIFEFGRGGGVISLDDSEGLQTFDKSQGAISFLELKFGFMLNDKLAITASITGLIYEFQDNDIHFGGFFTTIQ